MSVVSMFEDDVLCGCAVSIYTHVTAPYGDGMLNISLVLPDKTTMLLSSTAARSVVELGKDLNLYKLTQEDKQILISSAQHNLKIDEVKREAFNKIRSLEQLFNRD